MPADSGLAPVFQSHGRCLAWCGRCMRADRFWIRRKPGQPIAHVVPMDPPKKFGYEVGLDGGAVGIANC